MQTTFIFSYFLVGALGLANLGCAKPALSENLMSARSSQDSPTAEIPSNEPSLEEDSGVQFGGIEIAGPGCNISAGMSAKVSRDYINLPDFALNTEFSEPGLFKRSSCNLAIPFQTQNNVGFVITGFEFEHEHFFPAGTQLRLSFEAFIPGMKTPAYEETVLGNDTRWETETQIVTLTEPLVVCGKPSGLLRINSNQTLDRHSQAVTASSHIRDLKIQYVPIDCSKD